MLTMLLNVIINSEYISSAPSSSTQINATFLSWFLNVFKGSLIMLIFRRFPMDVKLKGYEASDHISTNVKVYPLILSTLKNEKCVWSMNPEGNVETSMFRPLVILYEFLNMQKREVIPSQLDMLVDPSWVPFSSFFLDG